MDKKDLLEILKPEIASVDQAMRNDLQTLAHENKLPANLIEVLEHALFNGGKRIRPLLCILTGRLCSIETEKIYPLAFAFEYLHVATLIHDDVIDHADTRRGHPAVNKIFGLNAAILGGDFLHARSMFLIGTLGGTRCLELICKATEAMVAGEFLQLTNVHDLNQSEEDYFSVISGKTALFIGAVCETGGIYGGASEDEIRALRVYGANLGLAFQIQDDLLDYLGDPDITGKNVGNDFSEGKMTLPLIHALKTAPRNESDFLLELLKGTKDKRGENLDAASEIIRKSGGFEYAAQLAADLIDKGVDSLKVFDAGNNREILAILISLANYAVSRDK